MTSWTRVPARPGPVSLVCRATGSTATAGSRLAPSHPATTATAPSSARQASDAAATHTRRGTRSRRTLQLGGRCGAVVRVPWDATICRRAATSSACWKRSSGRASRHRSMIGDELRGEGRRHVGEAASVAVGDLEHHLHGRGADEGWLADRHLPEHRAQGEDVGTGVHVPAQGLLRRHRAGGSDHQALGGQGMAHRPVRGAPLDETEVEHLDVALVRDHDVLGLDVPVDDAVAVGRGEGLGHHGADARHLGRSQGAGLQQVSHRLAAHQLHGQPVLVAVPLETVDLGDGRVGEARGGEGLATQPLPACGGELVGEQALEGNAPLELVVDGLVDLAHAPAAEEPDQPIPADTAALPSPADCTRPGPLPPRLRLQAQGSRSPHPPGPPTSGPA